MKRIGIVTIISDNYGNRLQNYAVQTILKDLGHECLTFKRNYYYNLKHTFKYTLSKMLLFLFNHSIFMKAICLQNKKFSSAIHFAKLNIFSEKYIHFSNECLEKVKQKNFNKFDFFICGSDQIWNPHYNSTSNFDFLNFSPNDKKIAYCASFGVDDLPENLFESYKHNLINFKAISVREVSGIQIIKNLINKEISSLIDPTLILTKSIWNKLETPVTGLPSTYLVIYFLDNTELNKKLPAIKKIAQEYDLQLIYILNKEHPETYYWGPSEFLYVLHHASYVCTDSFHGTVFSILYEKPFTVFERIHNGYSINSRIYDLLNLTHLEFRLYSNHNSVSDYIDYKEVFSILDQEKEKAIAFLNTAIN